MKLVRYIPPVVAAVCLVAWFIHQQREADSLAAEIVDLRGRIADAGPSKVPAKPETHRAPSTRASVAHAGPLKWRYLADQVALSDKPGGERSLDENALDDLEERLSGMSRDELVAALDEIAGLGLDPEARIKLENEFIGPLAEKDPAYALAKFSDRIHDDPDDAGSRLSPAIAAWAKQDPAAAAAWLDQQFAAGLFETKSLEDRSALRLEFEAALADVLIQSDPAAVRARIQGLPEDQRAEMMQQISLGDLSPSARMAYIEMTRTLLPEEEREGPFGSAFCELVPDGDYTKSAAFLDSIQATPAERATAAGWAADNWLDGIAEKRAVTREDVEATRQWLARQSPQAADQQLGEALGRASMEGGDAGFAKAAALALDAYGQAGNDDLLVSFLENADASEHAAEARRLAEKISDPARRAEILESLNE